MRRCGTDRSCRNFYPRPPRGGRRKDYTAEVMTGQFLSTPSARRATWKQSDVFGYEVFLSTPSARRATLETDEYAAKFQKFLSTPSARRATTDPVRSEFSVPISIHALREEGDYASSPSASGQQYFYPRPPRGGRLTACHRPSPLRPISIHALREEGDFYKSCRWCRWNKFLSTPSARRATKNIDDTNELYNISIHALREEGDPVPFCPRPDRNISIHALREEGDGASTSCSKTAVYFYPRPPRGGRHMSLAIYDEVEKFLSTPSARRATHWSACQNAGW